MTGQKKFSILDSVNSSFRLGLICLLCFLTNAVHAQEVVVTDTAQTDATDFSDILKKIFKKKKVDSAKTKPSRTIALLPSLGYNPSFGFVIGAKVSAIKQFGDEKNTDLSAFGLEFLYTSKGIITAQARHNVFTAENKWNLQGNWQLSKFLITDYNIGTGNKDYRTGSDSSFLIRFNYIRLMEKVYHSVGKHLYAGIGISMNIRYKIDDDKLDTLKSTPHYRYSQRNGLDPTRYSANALLLAIQYNTREHPLRSYGGTYADFNLVFDQKWLGSTKTAVQIIYDFRKYISLSSKKPEHVLAFWHIGSYKIHGTIPYLALPATGYDLYSRSGRGYTIGRFKGPSYAYFESEYRFPITRNKLLSGVAFFNLSTASDDLGKKLFQYIDHAAGGGLRVLFKKESRSTICIDYAKGKYGSGGFFFGLNEVF
jgi:hypothetical protein